MIKAVILLFLFISNSYADNTTTQASPLFGDVDGTNAGRYRSVKFTDGSTTNNGDGSVTVATGGSGGSQLWVTGNVGINTTNNVGIGSTNPGTALDVNGSIHAGNGTASIPSFGFINNRDLGIYRVSADTLGFATSGAKRAEINASGNVGIASAPVANRRLFVLGNTEIGTGSFQAGTSTVTNNSNSYAMGTNVTASGNFTFAGGSSTTTSGSGGFSWGATLTNAGDNCAAFGSGATCDASGDNGLVTGAGYVGATYGVGLAQGTAMGSSCIAAGASTCNGTYSASFGTSISDGNYSISSGGANSVGIESVALGHSGTTSGGTGSIAMGGYYDAGGDIEKTCSASNTSSICLGASSYATGISGVAIGEGASSTGDQAVVIGSGLAAGVGSIAMAGGSASGDYSVAIGNGIQTNVGANYSVMFGRSITSNAANQIGFGLQSGLGATMNQANSAAFVGGNVGIGTVNPKGLLAVGGNILMDRASSTIIMKSPDGTCSACSVSNIDIFSCTSTTCP